MCSPVQVAEHLESWVMNITKQNPHPLVSPAVCTLVIISLIIQSLVSTCLLHQTVSSNSPGMCLSSCLT